MLLMRRRLWIERFRRPLEVDRTVERRRSRVAREIGIGPALDERAREIEVAVDGCDQERGGVISAAGHVHVGAGCEKRIDSFLVAMASSEMERGHPAVAPDELAVRPPTATTTCRFFLFADSREPAENFREDVLATAGSRLDRRRRFALGFGLFGSFLLGNGEA